ncbi:MAG: vitamin B12 dependent-methionine synthase activation domain-containing protein [Armatimonadota bacterium]
MLHDNIPFTPDIPALLQRLQLDADSDFAEEVAELAGRTAGVGRPRALFREVFIEGRGEETVVIDGVTFTSRVLAANLAGVERVFPYVASCGPEFDALLADCDDEFLRFAMDCVKEQALWAAMAALRATLEERYGLLKKSAMHPGSGDVDVWPIEEQGPLFRLLGDVTGQIGVVLTDSFLMHPNKSVSGIFFATEVDFITCTLCHRTDCPNRRAPFDEHLWQENQGSLK